MRSVASWRLHQAVYNLLILQSANLSILGYDTSKALEQEAMFVTTTCNKTLNTDNKMISAVRPFRYNFHIFNCRRDAKGSRRTLYQTQLPTRFTSTIRGLRGMVQSVPTDSANQIHRLHIAIASRGLTNQVNALDIVRASRAVANQMNGLHIVLASRGFDQSVL